MDCKKIKDLISSGYIDAEIKDSLKQEVLSHLKQCSGCRGFEQALRKTAVEPFKEAEELEPPQRVWESIRGAVTAEQTGALAGLRGYLQALLYGWKPVFAAAVVIVVSLGLFSIFSAGRQSPVSDYLSEQAEFIDYLGEGLNGYADLDFGTSIEEYFL